MNKMQHFNHVEETTELYLDQADIPLATAENRVLRHATDNREAAEIALTALTLCLVSVFNKAIKSAYISGVSVGMVMAQEVEEQPRVESGRLAKKLQQYQASLGVDNES